MSEDPVSSTRYTLSRCLSQGNEYKVFSSGLFARNHILTHIYRASSTVRQTCTHLPGQPPPCPAAPKPRPLSRARAPHTHAHTAHIHDTVHPTPALTRTHPPRRAPRPTATRARHALRDTRARKVRTRPPRAGTGPQTCRGIKRPSRVLSAACVDLWARARARASVANIGTLVETPYGRSLSRYLATRTH